MSNSLPSELYSPLSRNQAEQLTQFIDELRADQLTWVSGYLAGLTTTRAANVMATAVSETGPAPEVTILYGSQTGNAENVAREAAEHAEARGFRPRVLDMADARKPQLKAAERLLVVVSTHGEGEPPDTAAELHDLLQSRKAPPIEGARFAVLALGDSSYEHFCQTGRDFDTRLEALGGARVLDRVDCDLDYEDTARSWIDNALEAFGPASRPSDMVSAGPAASPPGTPTASKNKPFAAALLTNQVLNGRGSDKETRHIELSVEDSGLEWQPGDSLGVLSENDPLEVEDVLATTGLSGDATIEGPRGATTLATALVHDYEITTLTRPFLYRWAELSDARELRRLLGEDARDELRQWMQGRHIVDVLQAWPVDGIDAASFVGLLRRMPPRLYSIASSHTANPDEVHLTVAPVRYHAHDRDRQGVASTWLADRVGEDDTVPVYIHANRNFRLPGNGDAPIIMVGPGTGVAPFRGFIEERAERGDRGRNWLFFGDRHFHTDFLYQKDWLRWRERGVLDRISVAFSRDRAEKVYVQDKLRQQGETIWQWLDDGACFYVCGDAEHMAPDVHQALIDIAGQHGDMSAEEASAWVSQLQRDKRYQRDIY